jgi:hypothetical protein
MSAPSKEEEEEAETAATGTEQQWEEAQQQKEEKEKVGECWKEEQEPQLRCDLFLLLIFRLAAFLFD